MYEKWAICRQIVPFLCSTNDEGSLVVSGIRLWNDGLCCLSESCREAGSLNIVADDRFAGEVILSKYLVVFVILSVRLLPQTGRAALLWTASRQLMAVSDAKSYEAEAYSKTGCTSCLYAVFLTAAL